LCLIAWFLPDIYSLSVSVLSTCNIEYESSFVDNVLTSECEFLWPDTFFIHELEVTVLTPVYNIKWESCIDLWLNCLCLRVKDEDLVLAIWSVLDLNVLVAVSCECSSSWHLGNQSEWSVWDDASLYWIFINVDNLPFLVVSIVFSPDDYIPVFLVLSA
jgi:hypothetical protein